MYYTVQFNYWPIAMTRLWVRNTARGILAAAMLAGCSSEQVAQERPRPAMVAHPEPAQPALRVFAGDVRARYEPELSFRVGGKISKRLVSTGERVPKGHVLAELDASDLALQTASARAAYAAAKADLALAQAELDRHAEMLERRLVSQSAFDARANALAAAKAQAERAQAALDVALNQQGYAVLTAPGDGVIAQRLAEAGQVVAAGQPVFVLALDGERDVAIGLPEQEIARFAVGQPVLVELWSRQGEHLPGTIRELAATADPQARTYAAKITFSAGDGSAELGQSARVYLGSGADGELAVPLSAIGGEAGQPFVWVIDPAKSRAQRVPVQVQHWGERQAVIEAGLSPSDWIVVGGVHLIREGQPLRPVDRDNRPVDLAAGAAP